MYNNWTRVKLDSLHICLTSEPLQLSTRQHSFSLGTGDWGGNEGSLVRTRGAFLQGHHLKVDVKLLYVAAEGRARVHLGLLRRFHLTQRRLPSGLGSLSQAQVVWDVCMLVSHAHRGWTCVLSLIHPAAPHMWGPSFVSFHAFWIIKCNPNTTIPHPSKVFLLMSSLQLGACHELVAT